MKMQFLSLVTDLGLCNQGLNEIGIQMALSSFANVNVHKLLFHILKPQGR
jgi:hypothetical protein